MNSVQFTKYYSSDYQKEPRWTGHVTRVGEMRNQHRILVGRKRPLVRRRRRWGNNNKKDFQEV